MSDEDQEKPKKPIDWRTALTIGGATVGAVFAPSGSNNVLARPTFGSRVAWGVVGAVAGLVAGSLVGDKLPQPDDDEQPKEPIP